MSGDGGPPEIALRLLRVRAASAGAGNRRALFARLDALLSSPELEIEDEEMPGGHGRDRDAPVSLRLVRLRNWRSFERAELRFGAGGPGRGLFIVGGSNGYGKSSILEAFAFALFGRSAMGDLGSLFGGQVGRGAARRSYAALMERVLHRSPRARDEGSCAVRLDFMTSDGPVEIERKWYFDEVGRMIDDDEELSVHVGDGRELLRAPDGVDPTAWLQGEIERRVMPVGLSPFFMFDGEQIERWADRRLSEQVRSAIERVLGLEDLAGLCADLREYARDRERGSAGDDAGDAERLRGRIERVRGALASARERLFLVEQEIAEERRRRDEMLVTAALTSSATHADLQASLERGHALDQEVAALRRELGAVLAELGPLALAGTKLAARVADEVDAEGGRRTAAELDRAGLDGLWSRFAAVHPPLDRSVARAMRSRLERAWSAGSTTDQPTPSHVHLAGTEHRAVATRLRSAGGEARERIAALRAQLGRAIDERAALVAGREADARREAERGRVARELAELAERLENAEGQRRAAEREVSLLEASLEPDLKEEAARRDRLAALAPRAAAAAVARRTADEVEAWILGRSAAEYARFAAAVGDAFRLLSHKGQISRVAIARDGAVTLFDARGEDVTDYRLSAGESQLFALALIAAVSEVTGRELPLVVDTPLSRLDTEHRAGVLRMLMHREGQTILLTQPEEVGPGHFRLLGPALAGDVRIVHRLDAASGVGVSEFAEGYLEKVAA